MLTKIVVSKQLLQDVLLNGVRLSACSCTKKEELKELLHTVPSGIYEDIVFVFSDGDKETDYLPAKSQRLRYSCERNVQDANE